MLALSSVVLIVVIIVILVFLYGVYGFSVLFQKSFVDSLYITALTMSGLSLEVKPECDDQRLFVAFFTLLSIGLYLILVAAIIACLLQPALVRAAALDGIAMDTQCKA